MYMYIHDVIILLCHSKVHTIIVLFRDPVRSRNGKDGCQKDFSESVRAFLRILKQHVIFKWVLMHHPINSDMIIS